jgi:hypothetical protein
VVLAAKSALKGSAYVFFYGYVLTLIAAGAFGLLLARLDARYLLGLDLTHLSPLTAATTMSQYRFLRAIELGFGVIAFTFRHEIFRDRIFNRLFLVIMACGIAGRVLGFAIDGMPSVAMLFFLAFELVGIVLIFAYTRTSVRTG